MSKPIDFDVLIAGGGLVGSALALALSRNPRLRIALVEAHKLSNGAESPASYDDRSVALAHATRLIFDQLGVWSKIAAACEPIDCIHISERGRFGATRLHAREEGVPALGYVIENRVLGRTLLDEVQSCGNVSLIDESQLVSIGEHSNYITATVSGTGKQTDCTTQLLVAADGADSNLRAMAGIAAREHDYRQSAIIANVSTETAHGNVAYERFTDTGPLALLPLSEGRSSLVMTVRTDQVDNMLTLSDGDFIDVLEQRFGRRLGSFTRVGRRSHFPLRLVTADAQGKGRVLLAGNARHYLHPVSGQGYNLAMRDVGVLAELLMDVDEKPIDANLLLAEFSHHRRADHRIVERFTDTLARLFTVPFAPLAHARAAGLIATDLIPFVRHALARQSMGLNVPLPRLSAR